jgi:hypothetical protein
MKHFAFIAGLVAFLAISAPSFVEAQSSSAPTVVAVQPVSAAASTAIATPTAKPAAAAPVVIAPVTPYQQQQWWQALLFGIVMAVIPIVAAMLVDLLKVLAKKYKIQVADAKLDKAAEFAIGWVEQKIVHAAKLGGKPTPADEAITKAIELAMAKAKETGATEHVESWWKDFIESKLGGGGTPAGEPPAPTKDA